MKDLPDIAFLSFATHDKEKLSHIFEVSMIWVSHHRKQKRLEGDCFFDGARLESVNICQASQVRRLTELPVETKGSKRCCRAMEKVEFRINLEFLNNKMKWELQQRFYR